MFDYKPNKFYFELVDCSGTKVTSSFEEDMWTNVMDNFVTFLKGCGYNITDEQLAEYFAIDARVDGHDHTIMYRGKPIKQIDFPVDSKD